jgi:RNA polymerase sigma-70 factor (ECF subfamily)
MTDDYQNTSDHPSDHTVRVQQLFVKNQSRLKGFILALQPDFSDAEDILQEVFLVITRKADQFAEGTNFMAWALSICRLKVFEAFRKQKTAAKQLSEEVMDSLCSTAPEEIFEESRSAAVRVCMEKLAPNMQEIMRLRYFAEHGPTEIARLLSWTPNAVNVALSKARKLMHECVGRRLRRA